MNDHDFMAASAKLLQTLETALENCGADLETDTPSEGILEINFPEGGPIIVNRHAVAKEIWVAARSGGFHFRCDEGVWRDSRGAETLSECLSRLVQAQTGKAVVLAF